MNEKMTEQLVDLLNEKVLRISNAYDRVCRECNRLKRENAKLRSAVTDIVGDKLTACKVLGERQCESEENAIDD